MKIHKRNKYQRIQYVKHFGFNTEDSILVTPRQKLKQCMNFLKDEDSCSIRTFSNQKDFYSPHHPIVKKEDAQKVIEKLQKEGYHCIVAKPIDPKDCLWCGAAMKQLDDLVIEIADGPGTVRRVTHEGKIDRRYNLNSYNRFTPITEVNYVARQFQKCKLDDAIFEFSWYNKEVGYQKDNFIVWEVTDNGTRRSGI